MKAKIENIRQVGGIVKYDLVVYEGNRELGHMTYTMPEHLATESYFEDYVKILVAEIADQYGVSVDSSKNCSSFMSKYEGMEFQLDDTKDSKKDDRKN